jgi:uncharacterized protein
MSEEMIIRVNFGKAMPVFPLAVTALMPHEQVELHVFEPRYRQMLEQALDGPGQFAMATFEGSRWREEYHAKPPIRSAVCVGQIVTHERLPGGTYGVSLRGVCRAKVLHEVGMGDEGDGTEVLYRRAYLEPVGVEPPDEEALDDYRQKLGHALQSTPLRVLRHAAKLAKFVDSEQVPSSVFLEQLGLCCVTDSELRYRLLATGDAERRAQIISSYVLDDLGELLRRAGPQLFPKTPASEIPRGVSLN